MNVQDSLRAVTRRALRIHYHSPAICPSPIIVSAASATFCAAIIDSLPITAAAGTVLSAEENENGFQIDLSWNSIENAFVYLVYRAESADGPFVLVATVATAVYADNPPTGGIWFYKVTGIEPNAGETLPSNVVSVEVGTDTRLTNEGEFRLTNEGEIRTV